MSKDVKISVIVPVYNTEAYLSKCLESLMAQKLRDIEIICVNDGSTDNSVDIIKKYILKDSRIRLIEKENGGLVSARKCGVKYADSEFVGFVDADDWVETDMYENLFEMAIRHNADMVSSGYIMEGQYISKEYDTLPEGLYENEDRQFFLENCIFQLPAKDLGIRGSLCCKLFKREILKEALNMIPDTISYSEDKVSVVTFALMAKRFYIIQNAWYHYIIHNSSMTQKADFSYLTKINEVYNYLVSLYDHPDFSINMRKQVELYITQLLIKGINTRMGFSINNLMWIDRNWIYDIPKNSLILVFGKGALCETYVRQIKNSGILKLIGCICDLKDSNKYMFDYILIAYKYKPKAEEIKKELILEGIKEEKILWFKQNEIFWKYAEDAGVC